MSTAVTSLTGNVLVQIMPVWVYHATYIHNKVAGFVLPSKCWQPIIPHCMDTITMNYTNSVQHGYSGT